MEIVFHPSVNLDSQENSICWELVFRILTKSIIAEVVHLNPEYVLEVPTSYHKDQYFSVFYIRNIIYNVKTVLTSRCKKYIIYYFRALERISVFKSRLLNRGLLCFFCENYITACLGSRPCSLIKRKIESCDRNICIPCIQKYDLCIQSFYCSEEHARGDVTSSKGKTEFCVYKSNTGAIVMKKSEVEQ